MCGIVGYIGHRRAQPILIRALKRLEYRGYDSCGIAVVSGELEVYKDSGRISDLEKKLPQIAGKRGIAHTRWATHGEPSQRNAHPHCDCSGKVAVVHNGVIENFSELRRVLCDQGHVFRSETDSEVMSHLVEDYYQGDLAAAVVQALERVRGCYAFIVLHRDCGDLVVARQESPVVIGVGDGEKLIASDVPALLDYTNEVVYLEDGDVAVVNQAGLQVSNSGRGVVRSMHRIPWSVEQAEKAGYAHFMLKEIHEQPQVIDNTMRGRVSVVEGIDLGYKPQAAIKNVVFVACGSSYYAAMVGEYLLEKLTPLTTKVKIASEFGHVSCSPENTLVVGVTQSGETADTIKALHQAADAGASTLAVTNVVGSSVTRLAEETIYFHAGPEISVAATKSFTGQLVIMYLLGLSLAALPKSQLGGLLQELKRLPVVVAQAIEKEGEIAELAVRLARYRDIFYLGRGINYPIALEGALKLKEIAYVHGEAYPGGELKHGPFALLRPETPVVAVVAADDTRQQMLTTAKEVGARHAPVIALISEQDEETEQFVDSVVRLPAVEPLLSPLVNVVALQLLAYYIARERGCPIDLPANLAKTITVP
ncbi:MAG: glutamine--fructose-6-phosphate transaminase (isomerizing) [Chloroflexota bacterium]